ncbi:acyltransferase [Legionella dresdenensis]|uniref:Acyltransferase n=1 Tax=Legionella dresdenensis TaxID=450200 RepID=A0ABV8CBY9_9GAMM
MKLNILSRIFLFSVCCLQLISCNQPLLVGAARTEFKQCQASCQKKAEACHKTCRNSCALCTIHANRKAAVNYSEYVHERTVKGEVIARQLQSYRDPLQCRKTTCSCPADYQVCMQSCGGVVHKSLMVAPVC